MTGNSPLYSEKHSEHQLRIAFSQRNSGPLQGDDDDGIATRDCPTQLREGLNYAYPELTNTLGWLPWQNDKVRDVIVRDLGPSLYGLAGLVGRDNGQMAINPRPFDALPNLVALRRKGTVIHELVHLLQFQCSLFQHFYNPSRLGSWDPNWWLHEASALAAEVRLVPEYPTAFTRLWDWAIKPHLSLDTDENGNRALPFVLYLMENVCATLPSKLYQCTSESVVSKLAIEALDFELQKLGRNLVDEFVNYCVTVSPADHMYRPVWLKQLDQIVGKRSYRERLRDYPVGSINDVPVDHLGCRYFRFKPTAASSSLTIRLVEMNHPDVIRATLSIVSNAMQPTTEFRLIREHNQLIAQFDEFSSEQCSYAVLTVANCAFGPGWANYDNNRFSLLADVHH